MQFLVNRNFFKSIPIELKDIISKKIDSFTKALTEDLDRFIFDLPKGFWVKKIKGSKPFFEFRVNSGDRIIFDIISTYKNEKIIRYCYYSKHDRATEIYKNLSLNHFIDYDIDFSLENDIYKKDIFTSFSFEVHPIDYIIENDDFFKKLADNENATLFNCLYLNHEQNECLNKVAPHIISGGAGSGKTAIFFNKMSELKKREPTSKIAYFSLSNRLKDNIKDITKEILGDENIFSFFSVSNFFLEKSKIDLNSFSKFENFKIFLKEFNQTNKYKNITFNSEEIFSEINGILKGMMIENNFSSWEKNFNTALLPFEKYLNLPNGFSIYDNSFKEIIYEIALSYQNWLEKNNFFDLNDIVRICINKNLIEETYDYIFIDEVQDLTEVQIFALNSLCKNNNIFFAGDTHQTVSMTNLNFSRLSALHKKENKNISFLTKNYRSKLEITNITNHIKNLRKKYIGSKQIEIEQLEETIVSGGTFSLKKEDLSFIYKTSIDANFIVLVPNTSEKVKLLKKLKYDKDCQSSIYTVKEAKGLEFKSIICYNLTSPFLNEWREIFNMNAKNNQIFRYYFNILYVAFTRAKSNIIFMESDIDDNPIFNEFLKFDSNNIDIFSLVNRSTKEEWLRTAKYLDRFEKSEKATLIREKAQKIKKKSFGKKSKESYINAIHENDLIVIEQLLRDGFNPNYENGVIVATILGHINILRTLIDYGANINTKSSEGDTPLMLAILNEDIDIFNLLIEKEIDLNIQNSLGFSPLILCAYNNKIDMAKVLLDKGANLNLIATPFNNFPVSAFSIAKENNFLDFYNLLEQYKI